MKKVSPIAYLLFLVGVLFVAYQFLLQMSPSVMVPNLMRDLSVNAVQVGFLSAGFYYSYIIFQFPSGALADRLGPQYLLCIALPLVVFSVFLFAYAPNYHVALFARVLLGLFAAPAFVCTLAIAANWFPRRQFALLAGITEFTAMLGSALNGLAVGQSVAQYGWQQTVFICAFVGIVLSLFSFWIVYRSRQQQPRHDFKAQKQPALQPMLQVLKNFQIWNCGIFGGALFAIVVVFGGLWAVPYLSRLYEIDSHMAGRISMYFFVGVGLSAPFVGWLSDYIGQRKNILFAGTLCALLAASIIIYLPPSEVWMRWWLFILGGGVGVFVLGYAVAKDHTQPQTYGAAIGFTNMLYGIMGAPIMQPLIGYLLQRQSNGEFRNGIPYYSIEQYQSALWPILMLLIIALLSLFLMKEAHISDDEDD